VASESDAPVDLYIVLYSGRVGAQTDWADIKRMGREKVLAFNALVLVSRETDGNIDIEDDAHTKGASTAVGRRGRP